MSQFHNELGINQRQWKQFQDEEGLVLRVIMDIEKVGYWDIYRNFFGVFEWLGNFKVEENNPTCKQIYDAYMGNNFK